MMQIIVASDGSGHCLYTEQIDLLALGQLQIRRGSYVEPDDAGHWWADLAPVAGPRLGPFPARSLALAAEERWLHVHRLGA